MRLLTSKWVWFTLAILALVVGIYLAQNDTVNLTNTSGSEIGLLVSGSTGGTAVTFQTFAPSVQTSFNILKWSAAPANNEVVAITESRPVAFQTPVPWTLFSDTVNISFAPEFMFPITIWMVTTALTTDEGKQLCDDTYKFMKSERLGAGFSSCDIQPAPSRSVGSAFLNFDCAKKGGIENRVGYTSGRINVYIVDKVDVNGVSARGNGTSCRDPSVPYDFIAVGNLVTSPLLAHELGHNFALEHVDGLADFDATNIMYPDVALSNFYTEGQLFRAHLEPKSALNAVYGEHQPAMTRACTSINPAPDCPALDKRIWADGAQFPPN